MSKMSHEPGTLFQLKHHTLGMSNPDRLENWAYPQGMWGFTLDSVITNCEWNDITNVYIKSRVEAIYTYSLEFITEFV
jgi:hypothetical protein